MYILDYLAGKLTGDLVTEYRLLCSGEVYNSQVTTADWRKSDATRTLLSNPFSLKVVSQPFDDYPQELCLSFSCSDSVRETLGTSSLTLRPDDDIAQDFAALLTVFLRRLITVYAKVRITYPKNPGVPPDQASGPYEFSVPIAKYGTAVHWKRKPVSIVWGIDGVKEVINYNPKPLAVHPGNLLSKLTALTTIPHAEAYVRAARLYAQGLRIVEEWPEIAYQLFVYSTETVANKALSDYSPPREKLVAEKMNVLKRAQEMGLATEDAEELAVLACRGMPWAGRKFRMFLKSMTDESLWGPDDLFPTLPGIKFRPAASRFDQTLRDIYASRSDAAHEGQPYAASIRLGLDTSVPARVFHELLSGHLPKVPPVCWFERVVNLALNRYVDARKDETDRSTA